MNATTCKDDFSVLSVNHIMFEVDHYNGTWYSDSVPLALFFSSYVECNDVKVRREWKVFTQGGGAPIGRYTPMLGERGSLLQFLPQRGLCPSEVIKSFELLA